MNREIEEMLSELSDIKEIKKTLTSWLKDEVNCGKETFDTCSCGAVSDIIKDMAETTRNCYEAIYYKTVIEAMESGREPAYGDGVSGYNHRHMGNGQFASAGRGHVVRGYSPYVDEMPYINGYLHDPDFEKRMTRPNGSMGYDKDRSERNNDGDIYENYRKAKRNYHSSKSLTDKEEMDTHHMMYMHNTLKNLKEMWDEADPMLRKKVKEDFGDEVVDVLDKM